MHFLVDGHNAISALELRGGSHEERRWKLVRQVAARAARATVFFDARARPPGVPSGDREGGIAVRYGPDADAAILAAVRDAGSPADLVVVTNDRELAGRATQLGARAVAVDEFFGPPPGKPPRGRPPPKRIPRFEPGDFGLPDEVDLSDPDLDED